MNCRGLANFEKRRDVFHLFKCKQYSKCCFQDVHFTNNTEAIVRAEWGLECYFNSFKSNSRGVAILFNNNFEFKVHSSKLDNNGNMLALDIEIDELRITLVNIYGPNNDSPSFFDDLSEVIKPSCNCLWGLEFNSR